MKFNKNSENFDLYKVYEYGSRYHVLATGETLKQALENAETDQGKKANSEENPDGFEWYAVGFKVSFSKKVMKRSERQMNPIWVGANGEFSYFKHFIELYDCKFLQTIFKNY